MNDLNSGGTHVSDWREYQEDVAEYFRSLGLDANTNVDLAGVRTHHVVDVVVRSAHLGFDVLWIVECKLWSTAVSKLHVLALRQIASDVGADRAFVLSESGFQSGAFEAASLTNVTLSTLADLKNLSEHDFYMYRLRELQDRLAVCNRRYWDISKSDRIDTGLRPDVPEIGYSAAIVMNALRDYFADAARGVYGADLDENWPGTVGTFPVDLPSTGLRDAVDAGQSLIEDLEARLNKAELTLRERSNDGETGASHPG